MANSVDLDWTASIGAVCSGSTLFASILNTSVMLGGYLQQTTSADDILDAFLLGTLRVKLFLRCQVILTCHFAIIILWVDFCQPYIQIYSGYHHSSSYPTFIEIVLHDQTGL